MLEEKFKKGDYIINRACGDMAVYDKVDKKGYMHFKYYYSGLFGELRDCTVYTMQINYQKFYELCDDGEKGKMDRVIEKSQNEAK